MKGAGADGTEEVAYTRRPKNGRLGEEEHLDALELLARLIVHISGEGRLIDTELSEDDGARE